MSQPTSVDVSIVNGVEASAQQASTQREYRSLQPGIAWFTAERAAAVLRNCSPQQRKTYIGMLSHSPSTIVYLRQEFSRPFPDISGEVRMRLFAILDEAEKHVDWAALQHMDS